MRVEEILYNPLLIIYTPLKRPMAPPSVFYCISSCQTAEQTGKLACTDAQTFGKATGISK